ncbi:MAG: hypothetical protein P1U40_10000 [Coxiellaceae bacterium]|nr:hypothetical protein [Coxiellaceae bacterium]
MSRNRDQSRDCGFGVELSTMFVLAVNLVGGNAYWKSPESAGGIVGLAALAVVDLVVVGAAAYGLYKCCKPKPSERQQQFQMGFLSNGGPGTVDAREQPNEDASDLLYPRSTNV